MKLKFYGISFTKTRAVKAIILVTLLAVLSCPKPTTKQVYEPDYLREAERFCQVDPLYAYNIIKNNVTGANNQNEKIRILTKIYLNQREYERAAQLLDSMNWTIKLDDYDKDFVLLKTKRWQKLVELSEDDLAKGIACYNLGDYQKAIEYLKKPCRPDDYRQLILVRAYFQTEAYDSALVAFLTIDSLSAYLFNDYQDMLFNLLLKLEDPNVIEPQLDKIKDPALRDYVLLRLYEKKEDKENLTEVAWKIVKDYPQTASANYALKFLRPKSSAQYKMFGKVYYYAGIYDSATKYLTKASRDDDVNFYLGDIHYNRKSYGTALKYLAQSKRPTAYYYRGRIYEDLKNFDRAAIVYDSLYAQHRHSDYATKGLQRKAFFLEDLGDTLRAVETFLKIGNRNTKFRAAMQLYKKGNLDKANEILAGNSAPEFVYWQSRIRAQLGEAVESLKSYLTTEYPLSYYSVVVNSNKSFFDTTSLEDWLNQLAADSTVSFDREDSLHIANAIRYFGLNEMKYARKELSLVRGSNPHDLLSLSRVCAQFGADLQSINYCLKIKEMAEKKDFKLVPMDLLKLIYPVRYSITILEQNLDLSLCLAMIWQESLFDPEAQSPAHAQGLMQIIPETAAKIAQDLSVASYSPDDAVTSIQFGSYYYGNMFNNFKSTPLALAGYNAGPINVRKWLNRNSNAEIDEFIELIPFSETRNYVKSILARQEIYKTILQNRTTALADIF